MEAAAEALVAQYLATGGDVFLSPQFPIAFDKEQRIGGSCPDFVALDFNKREILVVEVSTAASLANLRLRVEDRHTRWFNALRQHFAGRGYLWGVVEFHEVLGLRSRQRLGENKQPFRY